MVILSNLIQRENKGDAKVNTFAKDSFISGQPFPNISQTLTIL
jgi:hypothetical protein